jgi:ABC-type transporter Mla MlaB component
MNHDRAGTGVGINTLVVREIKTVIHEQELLVSAGRALLASMCDGAKKQQISVIINLLNAELQGSSERLNELITRTA